MSSLPEASGSKSNSVHIIYSLPKSSLPEASGSKFGVSIKIL